MCERKIASPGTVSAYWVLILFGSAIHVPIKFTDSGPLMLKIAAFHFIVPDHSNFDALRSYQVQVAAFDLIVPALAIFGALRGYFGLPSRRILLLSLAFIGLTTMHSTVIALADTGTDYVGLLKETIKSIGLAGHFTLLLAIFQSEPLRTPPPKTLFVFSVTFLVSISVFAVQMLSSEPFFFARTVYAVVLAGLLFLIASDGQWVSSSRQRIILVLSGVAILIATLFMFSKSVILLVLAMTIWILVCTTTSGKKKSKSLSVLIILVLLTGFGFVIARSIGEHFELLQRMDNLQRSIEVRLSLWKIGVETFWRTFPWGSGLGQLGSAIEVDTTLGKERHLYLHNSFLGIATELGLLGLAYVIGLISLILNAARGWRHEVKPLFLLSVLVPLFIHDAHSIRILLVIVALGLSNWLYQNHPTKISA